MFNRRRGFGTDPVPDNEFNGVTGYEEKTVFPMDNGSAPATAPQTSAAPQSASPATAVADTYGFTPASVTGERPRVFTTRERSNVYIYEYSDRLEYFVKLENTMFRFNVVYKA